MELRHKDGAWTAGFVSGHLLAILMLLLSGPRAHAVAGDEHWRSGFHAVGVAGRVYALLVSGGTLIVGGEVGTAGPIATDGIVQWDGETWSPFGRGIAQQIRALTTFRGDVIAAGYFDQAGDAFVNNIAAWDGHSWRALGGGIEGYVFALTCYGGGLIAGGGFTSVEGQPSGGLAAWDGTAWTPFGAGVTGGLTTVQALMNYQGRLIVAGDFTAVDGVPAHNIAAWDGNSWSSLGEGLSGSVEVVTEFRGELIAGGVFRNELAQINAIARWDGTSWKGLPGGVFGSFPYVKALGVHDDQLFVGGVFTSAGGAVVNCVARWDGFSWHPLGTGLAFPEFFGGPAALAFASFEGALYVGGYFSQAGGLFTGFLARWSDQSWHAIDPGQGVVGSVRTLCRFGDGVAAVGAMRWVGQTPAKFVALWENDRWDVLGSGTDQPAQAAAEFKGDLIIGGHFTRAGDGPANRVARWDGTSWHPVGAGFDSTVWSLATFQGDLIAGGQFKRSGTTAVEGVARWDGSQWLPVGDGLNDAVLSMVEHDGKLVAGGRFTAAGSRPVAHVAEWNGQEWKSLGAGLNAPVRALVSFDSKLIAGGFSVAASAAVAQWDGSRWDAIGSGLGSFAEVNALVVSHGALFAGGFFAIGGSRPQNGNIGAWDGTMWQPLGSGTNHVVYALLEWGSSIVVGGGFGLAGGKPSSAFAIWDTSPVAIGVYDLGAHRGAAGVALSWTLSSEAIATLVRIGVERSDAEHGPYGTLGFVDTLDATMRFVDATAQPPQTYWYRLALVFRSGETTYAGPLRLDPQLARMETALYPPIARGRGEPVIIRYAIGRRTPLTLAIYDARGRLVRTIEQRLQETGLYSRLWDRDDESGRSIAAGVYFVRLAAGGFEAAHKLVIQ